jgi:hypothetical protein
MDGIDDVDGVDCGLHAPTSAATRALIVIVDADLEPTMGIPFDRRSAVPWHRAAVDRFRIGVGRTPADHNCRERQQSTMCSSSPTELDPARLTGRGDEMITPRGFSAVRSQSTSSAVHRCIAGFSAGWTTLRLPLPSGGRSGGRQSRRAGLALCASGHATAAACAARRDRTEKDHFVTVNLNDFVKQR